MGQANTRERSLKVLVTGGAGYIGSVVVAELLKSGHDVVVYDNLVHGHAAAVPQSVELITADVGDRNRLCSLFQTKTIDAVMHFAAFIEAGESMQAPERYF